MCWGAGIRPPSLLAAGLAWRQVRKGRIPDLNLLCKSEGKGAIFLMFSLRRGKVSHRSFAMSWALG